MLNKSYLEPHIDVGVEARRDKGQRISPMFAEPHGPA